MAPLFTRIVPAALRETAMVLSRSSPTILNCPAAAEKVAVTAGSTRSASASTCGRKRPESAFLRTGRRTGRTLFVNQRFNHDVAMRKNLQKRKHGPRRSHGGGAGTRCSGGD